MSGVLTSSVILGFDSLWSILRGNNVISHLENLFDRDNFKTIYLYNHNKWFFYYIFFLLNLTTLNIIDTNNTARNIIERVCSLKIKTDSRKNPHLHILLFIFTSTLLVQVRTTKCL